MGAPNNHLKSILNFTKTSECTLLIYNMAQLVRVAKTILQLQSSCSIWLWSWEARGFSVRNCMFAGLLCSLGFAHWICGSRKPALQTEAVLCEVMDY